MNREKTQLLILRIVATIGFCIMIYCVINDFLDIKNSPENILHKVKFYIDDFVNVVTLVAFVFLVFKPYKLEYFSLVCFYYAFSNFIEPATVPNPMNGLMFVLGVVMLYTRGFFICHKIKKVIVMGIAGAGLVLLSFFRNGVNIGFFIHEMGCSFVAVVMLAVIFSWRSRLDSAKLNAHTDNQRRNEFVLNLFDFDLEAREREWIKKMLSGQKQASVASESGLSAGYFRNKVHSLYKKLDVNDYVDLLVKYGNFRVISTQEELEEWKKEANS